VGFTIKREGDSVYHSGVADVAHGEPGEEGAALLLGFRV